MTVSGEQRVTVLGAGNMGHGITEVAAMAGYDVTMRDVEADLVADGYENIEWSLEKLEEKGRLDEPAAEILSRVDTEVDLETAVADADLVVEGPPIGLKVTKTVMNEGADASLDAALAMESWGFGLLMSTEDVREGTAAFREDCAPEFSGE